MSLTQDSYLSPNAWRLNSSSIVLGFSGLVCIVGQPGLVLDTDYIIVLSVLVRKFLPQPVHLGFPYSNTTLHNLDFMRWFLPLISCIPQAGRGSLLCIPQASSLHIWHLAYLIVWEYPCSCLCMPSHNAALHTLGTQVVPRAERMDHFSHLQLACNDWLNFYLAAASL